MPAQSNPEPEKIEIDEIPMLYSKTHQYLMLASVIFVLVTLMGLNLLAIR